MMKTLKELLLKIFMAPKPLFFETNGKEDVWHLSLGRMAFWIIFSSSLYLWLYKEAPLPANMYEFLVLIIGYNFSKKLTGPIGELLKSKAKAFIPAIPVDKSPVKSISLDMGPDDQAG